MADVPVRSPVVLDPLGGDGQVTGGGGTGVRARTQTKNYHSDWTRILLSIEYCRMLYRFGTLSDDTTNSPHWPPCVAGICSTLGVGEQKRETIVFGC